MDIFKPELVKEDILIEKVLKPLFSYQLEQPSPLFETFNIYALAIFILGALILIYSIFVKLTDTATSGKADSWSAAYMVRMVLTMVLLFPVPNNFNLGVQGVIWLAGQGINLANYTYEKWDLKTTIKPDDLSYNPTFNNQILSMLKTATSSHLCILTGREENLTDAFGKKLDFKYTKSEQANHIKYFFGEYSNKNNRLNPTLCGHLNILYPEKVKTKEEILTGDLNDFATQDIFNRKSITDELKATHIKAIKKVVEQDALNIAKVIKTSSPEYIAKMVENSLADYNKSIKSVFDNLPIFRPEVTQKMKESGFANAGSWFFKISQINRQVTESLNNLPKIESGKNAEIKKDCRWYTSFSNDCQRAEQLANISTKIISSQDLFKIQFDKALSHLSANTTDKNIGSAVIKEQENKNKDEDFLSLFDGLSTLNLTKKLVEDSESVSNPLVRIQSIGQELVSITQTLILTLIASSFFNNGLTVIVMPMLLMILLPGLLLAFYIPLLPFIIYFGAIIGWVVQLAMGVFALPLWLVSWLSPNDNQSYIGKTGQGFLLLLEIFLRPFLIFVGLFISFLLINISAELLSNFFVFATQSIYSETSGYLYFMFLSAILMIFFVVLKNTMMTILELITELPNTIFQWIGSNVNKIIGSYGSQIDNQSNRDVSAGLAIGTAILGQSTSAFSKNGDGKTGGGDNEKIKNQKAKLDGVENVKPLQQPQQDQTSTTPFKTDEEKAWDNIEKSKPKTTEQAKAKVQNILDKFGKYDGQFEDDKQLNRAKENFENAKKEFDIFNNSPNQNLDSKSIKNALEYSQMADADLKSFEDRQNKIENQEREEKLKAKAKEYFNLPEDEYNALSTYKKQLVERYKDEF